MECKEARLSCATARGHRRSGGAARSSRAGARTRAGLALAPRGRDRAVMPLVSFTMRSGYPGASLVFGYSSAGFVRSGHWKFHRQPVPLGSSASNAQGKLSVQLGV